MVSIFSWENPFYEDHTVDEDFQSEIPEDGLVLEMLPVHDKDENNINDTSSYVSSQETETDQILVEFKISCGPEQLGSIGSDFLVKENYLGPTNLNE